MLQDANRVISACRADFLRFYGLDADKATNRQWMDLTSELVTYRGALTALWQNSEKAVAERDRLSKPTGRADEPRTNVPAKHRETPAQQRARMKENARG